MNRRSYIIGISVLAALAVAAVVAIVALTGPSPAPSSAPVALTTPATTATLPTDTTPPASSVDGSPAPEVSVTAERTGLPPLTSAAQRDADTVALAAIATLRSFDAAADPTQVTSARRTAYLLAPELAATLTREPEDGASGQWQAWAHTKTWASVTVTRTELPWALPADTETTATRVVLATRTLHDGIRTTAEPAETLQLALARSSAETPWRVTTIEVP